MRRLTVFILSLLLIAFLSQCDKKDSKRKSIDPEFASYIAAYTSGVISKESTIRVILCEGLNDSIRNRDPINRSLIEVSPEVEGKIVWINERAVELQPDKDLQPGTIYEVRFQLGNLVDVKDKLKVFEFEFQTIKPAFSFINKGIKNYENSNYVWMSGSIVSSDYMSENDAEELINAEEDGDKLDLEWLHSEDGLVHDFRIDSILRSNNEKIISISWDGDKIGIENSGNEEVIVYPVDVFKILSVRVIQRPEQYINIQFTDPVKKDQYLEGMIRILDGSDLRFIVDNNEIRAYPDSKESGSRLLIIEPGIVSLAGKQLENDEEIEIQFDETKPGVRFMGKGVIMPNSSGLIVPFEAVNLKYVDVKIIKIYEDNVGQFLQRNRFDGSNDLKRVGRPILMEKIELESDKPLDFGKWNRFSLDLNHLIEKDPGAIYRINLLFKKSYSLYVCEGADQEDKEETSYGTQNWDDNSYSYYYWYYPYDYSWYERDNPCDVSYYTTDRFPSRNILASDLGIIAKSGEINDFTIAVTDLISARPAKNIEVELYNYQNQLIAKGKTNNEGFAYIKADTKPFLLVAKKGKQRGYLRLDDGNSLSLSNFNVSGKVVSKGLKGYLYGERGVWRPGDTLFLTFILNDAEKTLPREHPVIFELLNPQRKVTERLVKTKGLNGFYSFIIPTDAEMPTGNWLANISAGGVYFSKRIKIETVKPNRLKINLDFNTDVLYASDGMIKGELDVNWLHGAPGNKLKAEVELLMSETSNYFKKYPDFVFNDPSRALHSTNYKVFDGITNSEGTALVSFKDPPITNAPGMLKANFITKAFEPGGNFSINFSSIPYAPYSSFVGLKVPTEDESDWLYTDQKYRLQIASVDPESNPVSLDEVNVKIYKVRWRWWWNASDDDLASYFGNSSYTPYFSGTISTHDGKGSIEFSVDYNDWGRYFIWVEDEESGHAAGKTVFMDWPGWQRFSREGSGGAASLLFVNADKEKYAVGDVAEISFPSSSSGRTLLTIESGTKVLEARWIEPSEEITRAKFTITPEMAPNVYAFVTLIQPHAQTQNDYPIRMYGVVPIIVENPETKLNPVISVDEELRPESEVTIGVSEENDRPMTYTLAVVDEGLLDLTNFKTPDPWNVFFAREALGVKTWDMYEYVIGAYGGRFERVFSIGGDDEVEDDKTKPTRANRFKPVVKFFGPYYLDGGEQKITFTMPNYIGAVRVMVTAGNEKAFGSDSQSVPVKNPLMTLATLPRTLSPGEYVKMPVTVFAMKDNIKKVDVRVVANDILDVKQSVKQIIFDKPGESIVYFDIEVAKKIGLGTIKVIVTSDNEKAEHDIELDVKNPNLPVTESKIEIIEAGEDWNYEAKLLGIAGTNSAIVDISGIPPIDLGKRVKYLIRYPYGCGEQKTSAVFPQLYLGDIMDLSQEMKEKSEENIQKGINLLKSMQLANGGFVFWPGQTYASDWLTSYVGHFMIEAEKKGFALPIGFKNMWVDYQTEASDDWRSIRQDRQGSVKQSDYIQAYRLFTLALAGYPEYGAMNILRNFEQRSLQATWALAAAYAIIGQDEVSESLIMNATTDIPAYHGYSSSYGSAWRDKAFILMTLAQLDKKEEAYRIFEQVSQALGSGRWMSTQTTAFCLIAVSQYVDGFMKAGGRLEFDYNFNGDQSGSVSTFSEFKQFQVEAIKEKPLTTYIKNKGEGSIYVQVSTTGTPIEGDVSIKANNLKLKITFKDEDGNIIDIQRLNQGTTFFAEVRITNPGLGGIYRDMALTQVLPSGWEILNYRIGDMENNVRGDKPEYQDIRDDRVLTFFDLPPGSKSFVIMLNATYLGKFYLPYTFCEAMYDNTINARVPGMWVEVVSPD